LSSDAVEGYCRDMADDRKPTREERLAQALRANLARRKARDRAADARDGGGAQVTPEPSDED
jgi:hypothetical protein